MGRWFISMAHATNNKMDSHVFELLPIVSKINFSSRAKGISNRSVFTNFNINRFVVI